MVLNETLEKTTSCVYFDIKTRIYSNLCLIQKNINCIIYKYKNCKTVTFSQVWHCFEKIFVSGVRTYTGLDIPTTSLVMAKILPDVK